MASRTLAEAGWNATVTRGDAAEETASGVTAMVFGPNWGAGLFGG